MEQSADLKRRVRLRPVEPADEEFLLDVYASTRADEMALVPWTDEQKRAFLRMQLGAQREAYETNYKDATDYQLILLDEQPVGRLWTARTEEQIRLLDIALLPEAQKHGIGTMLLAQLIAESEQLGKPLRHMVYRFNTGALRFYERHGFSQLGEAGAYLLMERQPASMKATGEASGR